MCPWCLPYNFITEEDENHTSTYPQTVEKWSSFSSPILESRIGKFRHGVFFLASRSPTSKLGMQLCDRPTRESSK